MRRLTLLMALGPSLYALDAWEQLRVRGRVETTYCMYGDRE